MKKNKVIAIGKIVSSLALLPLGFADIFHDVAYLQSSENTNVVVKVDIYHDMFENMSCMGLTPLAYVSFFLIGLSVILSVATLFKKENRTLTIASHIVTAITITSFLVILLMASMVSRNYC